MISMSTASRDTWQRRESGGIPVVILTKADLTEDYSEQLRAAESVAAGIDIVVVSAHTGYGIDRLAEYVKQGRTFVFLGSSGVGKSSLVNSLAGEEIMTVSGIREDDSKGRHTTTHRQLVLLKNGAMIIDTPGTARSACGTLRRDLRNFLRCRTAFGHMPFLRLHPRKRTRLRYFGGH